MPFQNCPNIAEFTLKQRLVNVSVVNVMHAYNAAGWSLSSMGVIAAALATHWIDNFCPMLSNQHSLLSVAYRDLTEETGAASEYTAFLAPGAINSEPIPNGSAMVVTLRTAYRGRSYRGRVYLCGFPHGIVNNGLFDTLAVEQVCDAMNELKGAFTSVAGARMTILSRYHNKVKREFGIGSDVTLVEANRSVDSQRRRKVLSETYLT